MLLSFCSYRGNKAVRQRVKARVEAEGKYEEGITKTEVGEAAESIVSLKWIFFNISK